MPTQLFLPLVTGEPVIEIAEVKNHLRIDGSEHDEELPLMIHAATRAAARECGLLFGGGACLAIYDNFPERGKPITLGMRVASSVTYVEYWDGSEWLTLAPAAYRLSGHTGRVWPTEGWPVQCAVGDAVRVEFVAGSPVHIEARQAILMILADYFENRGDSDAEGRPWERQPIPTAAKRLLWHLHHGELC